MRQKLIRIIVALSFISGQVLANPFGPNLPPVMPLPLPTTPSPGGGNTGPTQPTNPSNPNPPPSGRGGAPSWPGSPSPNPGWPSNPSTPYNPGPGIININFACPLVDQESNSDLLKALDVLEQAIQTVPECTNNSTLNSSAQIRQQMRSSAAELQRIWNDPEGLNENLPVFESQLQTMLTGIKTLTESLNNNSLLNSRCGQEMMSSGTALLAVSDLVTGVAPFALFAAAAAKSMVVAVPYVVGVVGLAGVVKVISEMQKNAVFDMKKYEHRQTLMKATCEYMRVATKVRYLKLAQSGQVEMLTREISQLDRAMFFDQQSLGGSLDEILQSRREFYKNIDEVRSQMFQDLRAQAELKKYLNRVNDDAMSCSLGMEIVENHRRGQFPASINSNFRRLLEFAIPHNEISLRATARQYEVAVEELESNIGYVSGYRMGFCGQSTNRFVGTLDRILQTIEEELVAQEQLFEKKMSENPIYKNWYARTSTLEKDRETLKRVVKTMERASQDSTVMSKSELHQRMENLRHNLFGSSGTLNQWLPWRSKAPLEAWLEHSSGEHARFVGLFNNSLDSLMKEVSEMRVENRKNKKVVKETSSLLPATRLNELFFDEMAHINFAFINAKNFPLGSAKQEAMCQRLEDSWLSWAAALDHLQAIKHLCANIASFIDSKTGSGVVAVCGRKRIDGKGDETSLIAKTETKLQDEGYKKWAMQVSSKLTELSCVGH